MTTDTEIQGTLTASPLPEVLESLEAQRATGVLNLASGGEVWIAAGRIYLVNSPTAPPLSSVLFGADVGSLEDLEQLLESSSSGKTALDEICASYPESQTSVERLLHEHNLNGLFEMIVPSDQQYGFRPNETHQLGDKFSEPISELMTKASGRVETWRKIATRIPSLSAVFGLAHSLPSRAQERLLTADEWRYLSYLNGRNTVSTVITETGDSAFRVTSALYRMLLEELIEEQIQPSAGG